MPDSQIPHWFKKNIPDNTKPMTIAKDFQSPAEKEAPKQPALVNQYWQIRNFVDEHSDDADFVIKLMKFRQYLNRDTIIIIIGEKRTGKSYAALKLAESLEEGWTTEHGCFTETKPFLEEFRNAIGRTFVLDEVSLSYSAQEWYSIQNKIFSAIVTSQGFRKNTLILTLPVLNHLDKKIISMAHYVFITYNVGLLRCYKIQNIFAMSKTHLNPFSWLRLGLPSKETVDSYEKAKKEYNDKRIDSDIQTFEIIEHPEKYVGKKFDYRIYIEEFRKGILDEEETKDNLIEAGYKVNDIEKIINLEKKKMEDKKISEEKKETEAIMSGHAASEEFKKAHPTWQ